MSATQFLFWFLSVLALFSAIMMVVSKNPVHSVIVADRRFLCDIRSLHFTQRPVSGHCKSYCICGRHYGAFSFCDNADEFKCRDRTTKK